MAIHTAYSQRSLALDVLRGSTVIVMVLVNMPGDYAHIYTQLTHEPWVGCTLADVVFPFFLFSVGVSGYLSTRKYDHNLSAGLLYKIFRRVVLLFILGILINTYPFYNVEEALSWDNIVSHWSQIRVFGVLQRIALTYGLGMLLCCWLRSTQAIIMAGSLILVMSTIGFILYNPANPYSMEHNISRAVDLLLPGAAFCYQGFGIPFEPEGVYGTMAATVNVMIGFLTGRVLVGAERNMQQTCFYLGSMGALLIAGGCLLSNFNAISKPLWTAAYVLYTSGLAILLLAILVYCLDVKKIFLQMFRSSLVFGVNPLFLYLLAELIGRTCDIPLRMLDGASLRTWQWHHFFQSLTASAALNSLLFGLVYVALYVLLAELLYRRRWFIKI